MLGVYNNVLAEINNVTRWRDCCVLCYVTGADVAAADAGQIPDDVRSNHREKYPSNTDH